MVILRPKAKDPLISLNRSIIALFEPTGLDELKPEIRTDLVCSTQ